MGAARRTMRRVRRTEVLAEIAGMQRLGRPSRCRDRRLAGGWLPLGRAGGRAEVDPLQSSNLPTSEPESSRSTLKLSRGARTVEGCRLARLLGWLPHMRESSLVASSRSTSHSEVSARTRPR